MEKFKQNLNTFNTKKAQKEFASLYDDEQEKLIEKSHEEALLGVQEDAKEKGEEAKESEKIEKPEEEKEKIKEIVLTSEQEEAKQAIMDRIYSDNIDEFYIDKTEVKEGISLLKKDIIETVKQAIAKQLFKYKFDNQDCFKKTMGNETVWYQEKSKQLDEMLEERKNKRIDFVLKIKKAFSLSEEDFQEAVRDGLVNNISHRYLDDALKIKESISLSDETFSSPEVQEAVEKQLTMYISNGESDTALLIAENFPLHRSIMSKAVTKGMISLLSQGAAGVDYALSNQKMFPSYIHTNDIINNFSHISDTIDSVDAIAPGFREQAMRSFDLTMQLFQIDGEKLKETAECKPFLIEALQNNPKFGVKLLIKYDSLDELSQENISTLFDAKKEMLENNPEMDSESLEFRQAMQEKLADYKNNPEIAKANREKGIDFGAWLNYSATEYFSLASGKSTLAFSETIATPIGRIKETIDSYAYTIKNVLKEYRQELSDFQTPVEDLKAIEEKITTMQEAMEQAKTQGNENKASGIAKGIAGLSAKLENPKTVSSWNKLLGDISAFAQLKNDVWQAQENLIQLDSEFQTSASGKRLSGREIQKLKQKMAVGKEALRSKFTVLERRIEDFKNNLPTFLSPVLGEERSDALVQEIGEKTAEQFDHYESDRSELANIFAEKGDKEKEKMESQPMSIFVWARNPDIDLYQGNYSDCCIRIDSDHMGAESTIADYATDVGVQIVNIWDETKDEPVTAAWCWLGENEQGESALVVDNIESNTLYSSNYPEQMKDELFAYLEKYAKAIGARKVVLGKDNNDLPTSGELHKMKDNETTYDKIGGYNRADGYFLEAEDNKVKIIWENMETEKVEKKRDVVEKVTFQDMEMGNIIEDKFSDLVNIERKIYTREDPGLIQGEDLLKDVKEKNGLEYSVVLSGVREGGEEKEIIGYIIAVRDKTDEGEACVYMEDIAVLPEAQGQGIGWDMMKQFVGNLKHKAQENGKPILLDMHLRENSQAFMEKHKEDLEQLGVVSVEQALVSDYYDEGEDALYALYEVSV